MKKTLTTMTAAFAAATVLTVPSASASTASTADVPGLEIRQIGYNAYGNDTVDNRNQEWIEITNSTGQPVDIAGLLIQDAWARGNNRTHGCNTVRIDSIPAEGGGTTTQLPSGHTIRVHMGAGTPGVDSDHVHRVYRDMPAHCGYRGHTLNNKASSNTRAPWDTVWISLRGASESKSYNFSFGYVAN